MQAVAADDVESVQRLLEEHAGTGVNGGRTALMLVAEDPAVEDRVEIAQPAKAVAFDVGDDDTEPETEPSPAGKIIDLLAPVEGGLSDLSGTTALMRAARCGHAWAVTCLAEHEATAADMVGRTALMQAAAAGHEACVDLLLDFEAGLVDKNGRTALMYAAEAGQFECAKLLTWEAGRADHAGRTALYLAASMGSSAIVDLLYHKEGGLTHLTPLHHAVHGAGISPTDLCVDQWVVRFARETDRHGRTALMHAAALGRDDWVRRLAPVEAGGRDEERMTALIFAAAGGHVECVEALMAHELGAYDSRGNTALWNALYRVLGLLPDPTGAASLARRSRYLECARLLLQYEAHVRDYAGHSPLMAVAAAGALGSDGTWTAVMDEMQRRAISAKTGFAVPEAPDDTGAGSPPGQNARYLDDSELDDGFSDFRSPPRSPATGTSRPLVSEMAGAAPLFAFDDDEEADALPGVPALSPAKVRAPMTLETGISSPTSPRLHVYSASDLLQRAGEKSTDGLTALWYAIAAGHADMAAFLLRQPKEAKAAVRGRGQLAALAGAADATEIELWLRDLKADQRARLRARGVDWDDRSPLHHAAAAGRGDVCAVLAPMFAGRRDINGRSALMVAATVGSLTAVNALAVAEAGLQDGAGRTALHLVAAAQGVSDDHHRAVVQALARVEAGKQTKRGETALMLALDAGNFAAAAELACAPSELGRRDHHGHTALQRLMRSFDTGDVLVEIPAIAFESGLAAAEAVMVDPATNLTPVWDAIDHGNYKAARQLLALGPETAACPTLGLTPLMAAVCARDDVHAPDLLSKYAGQRTVDGRTALSLAAAMGFPVPATLLAAEAGLLVGGKHPASAASVCPENAPELQREIQAAAEACAPTAVAEPATAANACPTPETSKPAPPSPSQTTTAALATPAAMGWDAPEQAKNQPEVEQEQESDFEPEPEFDPEFEPELEYESEPTPDPAPEPAPEPAPSSEPNDYYEYDDLYDYDAYEYD